MTLSFFIPNKNEIVASLTLFFLIFTFYSNGFSISRKKEFNINLVIGWSFFSFICVLFGAVLKIKLNYIINIYTISSILLIVKNFKYFRFLAIKKYLFLIPVFFLFLNTKSHGWDSYAYILDRTIYLFNNDQFPIHQFRANYPFSSSLIHYYSNFYSNNFTENIPALFDLILVVGSIEIFSKLLFGNFKTSYSYLTLIFSFLVLFNPMVMNVYSFSAYEDFHVAYILLVIFYFNYQNGFDLKKLLTNKKIYFFLLSLLTVSKAPGFVHSGSILLANLLVYLFFNIFDYKIFKKYIILCLLSFSQFFLWQYHILINDIFIGNNFKGFRLGVFENILVNYYNQFLVKKLLVFSNFLFMFSSLIICWAFKDKKIIKMFVFVSIPVFIWNLFLLIFFIFIQGDGFAKEFHNFFRFLSHFSLIFTSMYLIVFFKYIKFTHIKIIKFKTLLLLMLYIAIIMNLKYFRRDLSDEYKILYSIKKEGLQKIIKNKERYNNLENIIINFHKKNQNILKK